MLVAASEVRTVLRPVFVAGFALLPLGEVTAPVVDRRVAGLLALGEVAPVLFLRGLARCLLAYREAAVLMLGVIVVGIVIMIVVIVVIMIVAVLVVGMLAHARVSQRYLTRPL